MGPLTVDSSVFISCFINNDRFHKESAQFFSKLIPQRSLIVVPALVVCEVLHVLRKFGSLKDDKLMEVNKAFLDTNRFKLIPIDTIFIERFVKTPFKSGIKTSDAIILVTAIFHKTTLVSWDRQLLKNCKGLVAASTPEELWREG